MAKNQTEKIRFLAIDGFFDFKCNGAECRDTCCSIDTWTISIDDVTREKYAALGSEKWSDISSGLTYSQELSSLVNKANEHGECHFLSESRLCKIHSEYGEEYLCDTCYKYPKAEEFFYRDLEVSLSMSCPEVVRLFLFRKELIKFKTHELPRYKLRLPDIENDFLFDKSVRNATINILQNREHSLFDRLIHLKLLYDRLNKIDAPDYKLVAEYARKFTSENALALHKKNIYERYCSNSFLSEVQQAMLEFVSFFVSYKNPEFRERVDEFLNAESLPKIDKELFLRLILPYHEANPHVAENYLVLEAFRTQIPKPYSSYKIAFEVFAGKFVILIVLIMSLHHDKEFLSDTDILNTVYILERRMTHSDVAFERFVEFCESKLQLEI